MFPAFSGLFNEIKLEVGLLLVLWHLQCSARWQF